MHDIDLADELEDAGIEVEDKSGVTKLLKSRVSAVSAWKQAVAHVTPADL
jgi:hypothetical protein